MKQHPLFLDSTIFLEALVAGSSKRSQDSKRLLRHIRDTEWYDAWTSSLVIAQTELICEQVYHLSRKDIEDIVRGILGMRNLRIVQKIDIQVALEIYEKHTVAFVNALVASNARLVDPHVVVVSYDKDFDAVGLTRREPKQITEPKKPKKK